MLAALVAGFLIFSGGNGFAARMFSKDTQAVVREVVADPSRAEAADRTIELGRQDLEGLGKQFEKIAKGFSKADEVQSAGLDELSPFMQQAFGVRRSEQEKAVDRLFELREALTADEWSTMLARLK